MKTVKITLYLDVYPGIDLSWVIANSRPTTKMINTKRYAIEVEIPDPNEVDQFIQGKIL